jgi:outer membrane lipoprotein-sorting protein
MTLRRIFPFLVLCFVPSMSAAAENVDDLVARHVAARGGLEALRAIANLTATGTIREPGSDAVLAYKLYLARPGSVRIEESQQGLTAVSAFDGTTAWRIEPFEGRKDPERVGDDTAKALAEDADFEDALVDYKAKGNVVDYLGSEDVDGAPAFALRATLKNGDEQIYYLDPDAMLTIRLETKRFVRGAESQSVTDYGDYEKVAGVWFPFELSRGRKASSERSLITLNSVVANGAVPASLFAFPQGR